METNKGSHKRAFTGQEIAKKVTEAPFYLLTMLAHVSKYGFYAELARADCEQTCTNATNELQDSNDRQCKEYL